MAQYPRYPLVDILSTPGSLFSHIYIIVYQLYKSNNIYIKHFCRMQIKIVHTLYLYIMC